MINWQEKDRRHFISFEGIDFAGKSTQIQLLKAYLEKQGQEVFILREPGGTSISEAVRHILLDHRSNGMSAIAELFLFSAARTQLISEKIIPMLQNGAWVLADRYVDSTTAYQGFGRQLEPEMVEAVNRAATFGLLPGLTVYLELPPQAAVLRREQRGTGSDRLESSGIEFYQRVFDGYKHIAARYPDRFQVFDATKDVFEIHAGIVRLIRMD